MSRHTATVQSFIISFRVNGRNKTSVVKVANKQQAERIATSYPHAYSIRKIDYYRVFNSDIELTRLKENIAQNQQISSAIKMDEMVWLRRNERRENSKRDKRE